MVISILLGLGWILAVGMGLACWALIYQIGSRYAYTPTGISRMGPRLGESLASITFITHGKQHSLEQIISRQHPTLLVFLNKAAQIELQLITDLLRFAALSHRELKIVVFVDGPLKQYQHLLQENTEIELFMLSDKVLPARLGVRVVPYALLVDQQMRLRAKGLVNYLPHLCYITASARPQWDEDTLSVTLQGCQPYLPTPQQVRTISELAQRGR